MKKIALYGTFSDNMMTCLKEKCPEGFSLYSVHENAPVQELAEASYIISRAGTVGEAAFEAAPKLRFVQKWGVGYDKIDVKAAGRRGIPVSICTGGNSLPVAELTVALMLAVLRNVVPMNIRMKAGQWDRDRFFPRSFLLSGKTVGLVGIGNIAKKVAAILRGGFDCKILYYDLVRLPEEIEEEMNVQYVSLSDLVRQSDVISLHVPLLPSTEGMIDREKFSMMKSTAIIINTSRGGVINEQDLIEALEEGTILGAGLDTYSQEPLSKDSPLHKLEQVVTTPHCGGNTVDNDINMAGICMHCIQTYDASEDKTMQTIVNKEYLA